MKVMEYRFPAVSTRSATFTIYPLGDVHIGALNCGEKQFRRVVKMIQEDPNAYWFGGGDMLDAVIIQDQKRFDPNTLPDWMLQGAASSTRKRLKDILAAQQRRFVSIVEPIKDKCIGLMEGNHEYSLMKYHNRDVMDDICDELDTVNLTDCCFLRLKFERMKGDGANDSITVRLFAAHGNGGGRTVGSEPNHLSRLAQDKVCELVLRGHSHTQHILPPIARLTIPTQGVLGEEAEATVMRAANWGTYLKTYAAGPSTYDSRATYPVRPLSTIRIPITPFRVRGDRTRPKILIEELEL